jgi:hypothetical protein
VISKILKWNSKRIEEKRNKLEEQNLEFLLSDLTPEIVENIKYLKKNKEILETKSYKDPIGENKQSNCLGTALYILNLDKHKKEEQPQFIDGLCFSQNYLELFFDEKKRPGSILYFEPKKDWKNYHFGIYLKSFENHDFLFEQRGRGGEFRITSIKPRERIPEFNLKYYYPKKNCEKIIQKSIKACYLDYIGITPEIYELSNNLLESEIIGENDAFSKIIYQTYLEICKSKQEKPIDYSEYLIRQSKAKKAMQYGTITTAANKVFVDQSFNPIEYLKKN